MSSPACEHAWRCMAKWFSGNDFALPTNVARSFSCAPTVIVDNAIAASLAAIEPGSVSGDAPIAGTNRVRKDGSIIVTGSGNTVSVGRERG